MPLSIKENQPLCGDGAGFPIAIFMLLSLIKSDFGTEKSRFRPSQVLRAEVAADIAFQLIRLEFVRLPLA